MGRTDIQHTRRLPSYRYLPVNYLLQGLPNECGLAVQTKLKSNVRSPVQAQVFFFHPRENVGRKTPSDMPHAFDRAAELRVLQVRRD